MFNYHGLGSYTFLLDWLFSFVAFHWCVFTLDGDRTLETADLWSSGFISAVQSKGRGTQAVTGVHAPQAECPDKSRLCKQGYSPRHILGEAGIPVNICLPGHTSPLTRHTKIGNTIFPHSRQCLNHVHSAKAILKIWLFHIRSKPPEGQTTPKRSLLVSIKQA